MKCIRIDKDLKITWSGLLTNGEAVSFMGRDIKLYIKNPLSRLFEITDFVINDNSISFTFHSEDQNFLGVYSLVLYENKGTSHQTVLDYCDAFCLVATTCQEGGDNDNGIDCEFIDISGGCLSVGVPGLSAYELAVKNGYHGSEEEWLADLALTYDELTPEQIEDLQRPATEAAEKADEATAKANDAAEKAIEAAENIPVYLLPVKDVSEINI